MPGRFADADPILFDLDGTLTASDPGILASVRYALEAMGEPVPGADQLARFIGPPLAESFSRFCGMDPDRVQAAITAYRVYFADRGQFENSVYAGIPEVLAALRAEGRELAVATSKAEVFAGSILAHFDLEGFFTAVVGSELDGRRTAKSEVITEALARLGRPRGGAVMIGDRFHDVVGARTVGIPCLGALWGYGITAELTGAGADLLVDKPTDLLTALLR